MNNKNTDLSQFQQELYNAAYGLVASSHLFMTAQGVEAVDAAGLQSVIAQSKFRELLERAVSTNKICRNDCWYCAGDDD